MTQLFVDTLKGLAFEWFMKLNAGAIKSWNNLEKLFLARFFEDVSEVAMTTFSLPNSKRTSLLKPWMNGSET